MIDQALERRTADLPARRGLRGVYLGLRRCGLSVEQAGNLTARLEGIGPVPGGWSVEEVERLQFARWLVDTGLVGEDDRTPARDGFFSPLR